MTIDDLSILVREVGSAPSIRWGLGSTLAEALQAASNPRCYEAFLVDRDTSVLSDGRLCHSPYSPPRLIHAVLPNPEPKRPVPTNWRRTI